jgi:hypothetical protein
MGRVPWDFFMSNLLIQTKPFHTHIRVNRRLSAVPRLYERKPSFFLKTTESGLQANSRNEAILIYCSTNLLILSAERTHRVVFGNFLICDHRRESAVPLKHETEPFFAALRLCVRSKPTHFKLISALIRVNLLFHVSTKRSQTPPNTDVTSCH